MQWEHQHGHAGVYPDSSRTYVMRGAELRGVERVHRQRYVRPAGDSVEDADELQLQLRKWAVRGVHEHRDAGVYAQSSFWMWLRPWLLDLLRAGRMWGRPPLRRGGWPLHV